MSAILKRSVSIHGHRTSYSLEKPFVEELDRIARGRGASLAGLVAEIDATRPKGSNLSSALRVFVLETVKTERVLPSPFVGEGA